MNKLSKSTPKVNLDDLTTKKSLPIEELLKNPKRKRGKKKSEEVKKIEVIINKKIIIDSSDLDDQIVKDLKRIIKQYNDSKKVDKVDNDDICIEEKSDYIPNLVVTFD